MQKIYIHINEIPAILWGNASEKVFLYIHGQGGNKEEAKDFAEIVCQKSWQVLSIELPEHGVRKNKKTTFEPWNIVPELTLVMEYIRLKWLKISLYANSIGAWFSMLSFQNEQLNKCLFVSPILDMTQLISNMMSWADISEERLECEHTIPTSFGQTLSWKYLLYARQHSIEDWHFPTEILYGEKDNFTEFQTVKSFADRFSSNITIMPNGEHWFHTSQQLKFLKKWVLSCLE